MPKKNLPEPVVLERLQLPRPSAVQMEQLMIQLAGDTRFQLFIETVRGQREAAIEDLCNDAVVESHAKLAAAVGEIRTYSGILSLADAHIGQRGIISNDS